MPDADDFDVESLRSLFSGGGGKKPPETPAPAKKSSATRAKGKATPRRGTSPAKTRRKP
jgi:hypothetical protein